MVGHTTFVMSMMDRPRRAAATALTPTWPPKIHRPTVTARAPAVIFSLRDRGPSFFSSSLIEHTYPLSPFENRTPTECELPDVQAHVPRTHTESGHVAEAGHVLSFEYIAKEKLQLILRLPNKPK